MDYLPIKGRHFGAHERLSAAHKDEQKQWASMRVLETREHRGRVVSISYSPIVESTSVVTWTNDIEALVPMDAQETIFKMNTPFSYNSARFRRDGALIVYTEGSRGKVAVVDRNGKPLRSFAHHTASATGAVFTSNKVEIASWGVDRKICLTSLATADVIFSVNNAHEDTIQAGDTSTDQEYLFATGCGLGTIKLWDSRVNGCVQTINASEASQAGGIYSLKFVPAAAENKLIFGTSSGHLGSCDLRNGEIVQTCMPHSKALTDLCFAMDNTRLLSVGLDGKLCVHEMSTLKTIYSSQETYTGITSIGCTSDGKEVSIGQENGNLIRKISATFASTTDVFAEEDEIAHWSRPVGKRERERPAKPSTSDVHLRAFSYKKSLMAALEEYEKTNTADTHEDRLYGLIDELLRRNALRIALTAWNEKDITRMLVYLITHMRHRNRCVLMITALEVINEIYSEELIKSPRIAKLFGGLNSDLELYLQNIRECEKLSATIEAFL